MTAEEIGIILSAVGVGTLLRDLLAQTAKWITGRSSRERTRNDGLDFERKSAIAERDQSDDIARMAREETARYRRGLIEAGIDPDKFISPHK